MSARHYSRVAASSAPSSRSAPSLAHAFLCTLQCSAWCSALQYHTVRQPEQKANFFTERSTLSHEGRAQLSTASLPGDTIVDK